MRLSLLTAILTTGLFFASANSFSFNFHEPVHKRRAQEPQTNIEIGGGMMGSVLYLSRNTKDKNDAYGYSFMFNYGGQKLLRYSFQYTKYKAINIEPTWYNINASTIESNIEVIAKFKDGASFLYPYAGLSYNMFSGFFTGKGDYLNLREKYEVNATAVTNWFGLNVGTGFQHDFGRVVVYFDYRMRVGQMKPYKQINIMDVCYGGGLRYKIPTPSIKKLYKGLTDKYTWF